jgi:hypothetical protein
MRNTIGAVRARCLLARALVAAGKPTEADDELQIARQELGQPNLASADVLRPIKARLAFAYGELLLHQRRYPEAREVLADAISAFAEECDRRSHVDALLLRGQAEQAEGHHSNANATMWAVAAAFECCRDERGFSWALEQLALTAEELKNCATAAELRIWAGNGAVRRFSPWPAFALFTMARSIYSHGNGHPAAVPLADSDVRLPV